MAAWMSAARRVTNMAGLSSPKLASPPQAASLIHRRHLATGEHHASRKVNFWEDPFSPSKWKEEHTFKTMKCVDCISGVLWLLLFVVASVAEWGLLFYGGYKYFSRDKNDKDKKVGEIAR